MTSVSHSSKPSAHVNNNTTSPAIPMKSLSTTPGSPSSNAVTTSSSSENSSSSQSTSNRHGSISLKLVLGSAVFTITLIVCVAVALVLNFYTDAVVSRETIRAGKLAVDNAVLNLAGEINSSFNAVRGVANSTVHRTKNNEATNLYSSNESLQGMITQATRFNALIAPKWPLTVFHCRYTNGDMITTRANDKTVYITAGQSSDGFYVNGAPLAAVDTLVNQTRFAFNITSSLPLASTTSWIDFVTSQSLFVNGYVYNLSRDTNNSRSSPTFVIPSASNPIERGVGPVMYEHMPFMVYDLVGTTSASPHAYCSMPVIWNLYQKILYDSIIGGDDGRAFLIDQNDRIVSWSHGSTFTVINLSSTGGQVYENCFAFNDTAMGCFFNISTHPDYELMREAASYGLLDLNLQLLPGQVRFRYLEDSGYDALVRKMFLNFQPFNFRLFFFMPHFIFSRDVRNAINISIGVSVVIGAAVAVFGAYFGLKYVLHDVDELVRTMHQDVWAASREESERRRENMLARRKDKRHQKRLKKVAMSTAARRIRHGEDSELVAKELKEELDAIENRSDKNAHADRNRKKQQANAARFFVLEEVEGLKEGFSSFRSLIDGMRGFFQASGARHLIAVDETLALLKADRALRRKKKNSKKSTSSSDEEKILSRKNDPYMMEIDEDQNKTDDAVENAFRKRRFELGLSDTDNDEEENVDEEAKKDNQNNNSSKEEKIKQNDDAINDSNIKTNNDQDEGNHEDDNSPCEEEEEEEENDELSSPSGHGKLNRKQLDQLQSLMQLEKKKYFKHKEQHKKKSNIEVSESQDDGVASQQEKDFPEKVKTGGDNNNIDNQEPTTTTTTTELDPTPDTSKSSAIQQPRSADDDNDNTNQEQQQQQQQQQQQRVYTYDRTVVAPISILTQKSDEKNKKSTTHSSGGDKNKNNSKEDKQSGSVDDVSGRTGRHNRTFGAAATTTTSTTSSSAQFGGDSVSSEKRSKEQQQQQQIRSTSNSITSATGQKKPKKRVRFSEKTLAVLDAAELERHRTAASPPPSSPNFMYPRQSGDDDEEMNNNEIKSPEEEIDELEAGDVFASSSKKKNKDYNVNNNANDNDNRSETSDGSDIGSVDSFYADNIGSDNNGKAQQQPSTTTKKNTTTNNKGKPKSQKDFLKRFQKAQLNPATVVNESRVPFVCVSIRFGLLSKKIECKEGLQDAFGNRDSRKKLPLTVASGTLAEQFDVQFLTKRQLRQQQKDLQQQQQQQQNEGEHPHHIQTSRNDVSKSESNVLISSEFLRRNNIGRDTTPSATPAASDSDLSNKRGLIIHEPTSSSDEESLKKKNNITNRMKNEDDEEKNGDPFLKGDLFSALMVQRKQKLKMRRSGQTTTAHNVLINDEAGDEDDDNNNISSSKKKKHSKCKNGNNNENQSDHHHHQNDDDEDYVLSDEQRLQALHIISTACGALISHAGLSLIEFFGDSMICCFRVKTMLKKSRMTVRLIKSLESVQRWLNRITDGATTFRSLHDMRYTSMTSDDSEEESTEEDVPVFHPSQIFSPNLNRSDDTENDSGAIKSSTTNSGGGDDDEPTFTVGVADADKSNNNNNNSASKMNDPSSVSSDNKPMRLSSGKKRTFAKLPFSFKLCAGISAGKVNILPQMDFSSSSADDSHDEQKEKGGEKSPQNNSNNDNNNKSTPLQKQQRYNCNGERVILPSRALTFVGPGVHNADSLARFGLQSFLSFVDLAEKVHVLRRQRSRSNSQNQTVSSPAPALIISSPHSSRIVGSENNATNGVVVMKSLNSTPNQSTNVDNTISHNNSINIISSKRGKSSSSSKPIPLSKTRQHLNNISSVKKREVILEEQRHRYFLFCDSDAPLIMLPSNRRMMIGEECEEIGRGLSLLLQPENIAEQQYSLLEESSPQTGREYPSSSFAVFLDESPPTNTIAPVATKTEERVNVSFVLPAVLDMSTSKG